MHSSKLDKSETSTVTLKRLWRWETKKTYFATKVTLTLDNAIRLTFFSYVAKSVLYSSDCGCKDNYLCTNFVLKVATNPWRYELRKLLMWNINKNFMHTLE